MAIRPRPFVPRVGRKVDYVISQVPHRKQRYETVGDWIPGRAKRPTEIRVSKMKDQRYVFLVALHEMIEFELCKKNGISDKEVITFDVNFEEERRLGLHSPEAEPGNHPRAPYRDEHNFATMIESMVARKLGVKWSDYEKAVTKLGPKRRVVVRPLVRRPQSRNRY
jgi:hypothetical protein